MKSIEHYSLPITRGVFRGWAVTIHFIPALNIALYLSADEDAVRRAIQAGYPAGLVLASKAEDDETDDLRISFDFDGVLADDSAERTFQSSGLQAFHEGEAGHVDEPLPEGPILPFLRSRTARPRDDMRQPATTKATRALSQIAETLDRAGVLLLRRLASFPRPLCP
jgi:5'-nucleotidase